MLLRDLLNISSADLVATSEPDLLRDTLDLISRICILTYLMHSSEYFEEVFFPFYQKYETLFQQKMATPLPMPDTFDATNAFNSSSEGPYLKEYKKKTLERMVQYIKTKTAIEFKVKSKGSSGFSTECDPLARNRLITETIKDTGYLGIVRKFSFDPAVNDTGEVMLYDKTDLLNPSAKYPITYTRQPLGTFPTIHVTTAGSPINFTVLPNCDVPMLCFQSAFQPTDPIGRHLAVTDPGANSILLSPHHTIEERSDPHTVTTSLRSALSKNTWFSGPKGLSFVDARKLAPTLFEQFESLIVFAPAAKTKP